MSTLDWELYHEQFALTGYNPCEDDDPLETELTLLETVLHNDRAKWDKYTKLPTSTPDSIRRRYIWASLDEDRPDADEMFDRLVGAGHLDAVTWFRVFTERL